MRTKKSVSSARSSVRAKAPAGSRRLSRAAISRLSKPHTGFDAFVEPLAKLVEEFASELGLGGIDVELMRSSLRDWQEASAKRAAVLEQLAPLDDARLVAMSAVWDQELLIYAAARQAARTNGNIEGAIDGFAQFMKSGPHKKPSAPAATQP